MTPRGGEALGALLPAWTALSPARALSRRQQWWQLPSQSDSGFQTVLISTPMLGSFKPLADPGPSGSPEDRQVHETCRSLNSPPPRPEDLLASPWEALPVRYFSVP